jgi:hypothetical protein
MICPICIESIGEANKAVTECNHTFHVNCLAQAVKSNFHCPNCRKDLASGSADLERARAAEYDRVLHQACAQVDYLFNTFNNGKPFVNISPKEHFYGTPLKQMTDVLMFLKLGIQFTHLQEKQRQEMAHQKEKSQADIDILSKLLCETTKVFSMQAAESLDALQVSGLKPELRKSLA